MVSAAHVLALQGRTGPALLDGAAKAVGFPWLPSTVTEPIDVAQPWLLDAVREDWARAADMVDENILDLDRASMRVLDNWTGDSAKAFFDYVTELIDVVEGQQGAMASLVQPLERIQTAVADAQRGIENARIAAVNAMLAATAVGVGGVVAAGATGPSTSAAWSSPVSSCVTAIVKALTAYVTVCFAIRSDLEKVIDAMRREMDTLAAKVSHKEIRQLTAPPPPRFSHEGFHSVNEPDDIVFR